jgi:hypothetical protein
MLRPRRIALVVYLLASAVALVWVGRGRFDRQGDGWEYYATLEAFDRHGSFDVRAEDRQAVLDRLFERHAALIARSDPPEATAAVCGGSVLLPKRIQPLAVYGKELDNGYLQAPDGRWHAVHFWLYPLSAYPAKLALRAVGGWEFNALKVTNAALFALAVGLVLFRGRGTPLRRVCFALLGCVTPVVWYLPFTGAEVFSWSLVTIAMVGLDTERYARSAWAAGLAATQNPPLVLLAAVPVLVALRQRRWKSAALATIGAATAFLPAAYYLYHFGRPSLITASHTDPRLISIDRTLCLLFDLNVGLMTYVPVLLIAAAGGAVALFVRRDVRGILVTLALIGMLVGVQVQVNWNSDCRGMMRYLVWMLPPMAWLVIEGVSQRLFAVTVLSVFVSGAILVFDPPTPSNSLEHRPLARRVMTHLPWAYNPEFEIFVERLAHREDVPFEMPAGATAETQVALPIGFGTPDGVVTKLLVHRESVARLTQRFTIAPDYLPELLRIAEVNERPVYVHPPAGAVRAEPGTIHGTYDARKILRLDGSRK